MNKTDPLRSIEIYLSRGVCDLSQSLGRTGEVDHPDVLNALETVAKKCKERGCMAGTFVEEIDRARAMADLGLNYLCYSVDVGILADAATRIITQITAHSTAHITDGTRSRKS